MDRFLPKFRKLVKRSGLTKRSSSPCIPELSETVDASTSSVREQKYSQSEAARARGNAQNKDLLTTLPPELRLQILSMLGLDGLSALVHASPAFHQDYRCSRRAVLSNCLRITLRSVFVDAYAVYQSSSVDFASTRTRDTVTLFIHSYRDQLISAHNSHFVESLSEGEAMSMATFYFSVIKPLSYVFIHSASTNLANESKGSLDNEPPSKSEDIRLLRAFYRFQLCCNLFGVPRVTASDWLPPIFHDTDILEMFLCIFEPWEVEEIACIYVFAKEKYDQIFHEIRWDVHEDNPKFEGERPPTPDGAFDLDNSYTRHKLLEGTVSRGLDLLHTVFFRVSDHAQLVSAMQAQISLPVGDFLDEAWSKSAQWQLRQERLTYRERKQQRREPLLFTGDGDSETEGPRPPLAWTLMWRGIYSNLFGQYVDDVIRRWGYVVWDAERLERTGAKEVLKRQWKDMEDYDPRYSV